MTYRTLAPGPGPPTRSSLVDVAPDRSTGLPIGVGSLSRQVLDRLPYRSGALRRQRAGRGSIWEALDKQPITSWTTDRDRGCEPPRPARRDRVRLDLNLRRGRGVRLPRPGHRRTTWRRSTAPTSTPGDGRPATVICQDDQGKGFSRSRTRMGGMACPAPDMRCGHRPARRAARSRIECASPNGHPAIRPALRSRSQLRPGTRSRPARRTGRLVALAPPGGVALDAE